MAKGRKGTVVTLESIKNAIAQASNNTELTQAFGKLALIAASADDFQALAQAVAARKAELAKAELAKAVEKVKAEEEREGEMFNLFCSTVMAVFGVSADTLPVVNIKKAMLACKHLDNAYVALKACVATK